MCRGHNAVDQLLHQSYFIEDSSDHDNFHSNLANSCCDIAFIFLNIYIYILFASTEYIMHYLEFGFMFIMSLIAS
jgi:hypothetical protein